jgi:photosystem II stability/assembly factor-like uncharacterized protein
MNLKKKLNKRYRKFIMMTLLKTVLILLLTISGFMATAQRLEIIAKNGTTSIRGLSVVNDNVVWVSGSKGMVGRSEDGGKTWNWNQVKGFEKRDFRDIEAFDKNTAVILAIAEPGNILKTTDGGKTWKTVFSDSTKGIFIDAFSFLANGNGMAVGDAIEGKAYLIKTDNYGNSWTRLTNPPALDNGEGCFASSGTNIVLLRDGSYYFVTGGLSSRLHSGKSGADLSSGAHSQPGERLPLVQGKESTGANSIAILGNKIVIVGGDFARDSIDTDNAALLETGLSGIMSEPATRPHGYRSCVEFINKTDLIACGTSGIDLSRDGGKTWTLISKEGFHVCQKAKKGKALFLAGGNGKIAKVIFD